jgi:hypothetical protein
LPSLPDHLKPAPKPSLRSFLWRSDAYLPSVREPEALARLPLAERKEWEAFWAEVEAVIKRVGASGKRSHDLLDENEDIR